VVGACLQLLEPDLPNAIRGVSGNFLTGKSHGDFFAVANRAPDRHARVARQNGVGLEKRIQFRRNSRCRDDAGEPEKQRVVFMD
jgi:hypothetical protein